MSRTTILVALLIFLSFNLAAQDNYEPGYVVTLAGDSLKGTVNNQRWFQSPDRVEFKDSQNERKEYNPKQIKAFGVANKIAFVALNVNYDSTSNILANLEFTQQPAYKNATLFLKVLVSSELSLFEYNAKGRPHLFIQDGVGQAEELISHRYLDVGNTMATNKAYINQLKNYFKDCPKVVVSPNLSYSSSMISKILLKYNECKQSDSKVFEAKEKTQVHPGILLAVAFDQYRPTFNGGIGYGVGGFVNLVFPAKNYKGSLWSEIIYRKTGEQTSKTNKTNSNIQYQSKFIRWTNVFRMRLFRNYPALIAGGGVDFGVELKDRGPADLVAINTALVADVGWKATDHILLGLRFESGDAIEINTKRSSGYRFSLAWQF